MYKAKLLTRDLIFKKPAQTSRDTLLQKRVYLLVVKDFITGKIGVGENTFIKGLSLDKEEGYLPTLEELAHQINQGDKSIFRKDYLPEKLLPYPSIRFGLEMLRNYFLSDTEGVAFSSKWTLGSTEKKFIPINGLVWMGNYENSLEQIKSLLQKNFRCIKIKIGGINFSDELKLIRYLRERDEKIIIRLDANGSFSNLKPSKNKDSFIFSEAMKKINQLEKYNIHSIEQPLKINSHFLLKKLIEQSPIRIALDEELIEARDLEEKRQMLGYLKPGYLVLKPSLIGGVSEVEKWIELATNLDIKWWLTSALESSWGLSYLAQWYAWFTELSNKAIQEEVQGLGTGGLYKNNFPKANYLINDELYFDNEQAQKNILELNKLFDKK